MTGQPLEPRVQALEDDLAATKLLLQSIAERLDRVEELLASHLAETEQRRERAQRVMSNLKEEMERSKVRA